MRSTGFVFLSILVHCLAVAAIAMHPQRISEMQGDSVEVTMGEEALQAGTAEAPADKDTTGAPVEQPAPTPAPVAKETPAPKEPVVKETPQPKKVAAVAPVKKAAPVKKSEPKAETPVAAAAAPAPTPAPSEEPEKLQPDVDDAQPMPAAADVEDKKLEEEAKPVPVKETAPAGVSAADEHTEAAAKEEVKAADPVAAAAPAGATQEINQLTQGGELGKGGATAAGAVEYTELKQMKGNKPPVYPMAARREMRQGETELLYRVKKDGTVSEVSIAKSSGSEDLDNEAVRAVSKFRFVPGQEGWAKHPVQFNLKGDTAAMPSRLRTKVGAQE